MENMEFDTENMDLDNQDEEEDDLSLERVIQQLEEAWFNEKFAPEILPHQIENVDIVLGQMSYIEERLRSLSSNDFTKGIHQMEVDRLRFLVTSYLRCRLEKIETHCDHILSQEQLRQEKKQPLYLSPGELQFAQEYEQKFKAYMNSAVESCRDATDLEVQSPMPNIRAMVFLRSKKTIEGIIIDDGQGDNNDVIDLTQGSQILISYNSVSDLVKNGDIHLI